MTDTDVTTVRLPHTGLWVPDRSLTVTAYKEISTSCGVAFTANLRVNNRMVGTIENSGQGGMTMFYSHNHRTFGPTHLNDYAGRSRTQEGKPVTAENLLDELIEEHDWTRRVASAARKGLTLMRLMDHILTGDDGNRVDGFPPYPHAHATGPTPTDDLHTWQALSRRVMAEMPPSEHGWWQAWTGTSWRDVTLRPAGVNTELYS